MVSFLIHEIFDFFINPIPQISNFPFGLRWYFTEIFDKISACNKVANHLYSHEKKKKPNHLKTCLYLSLKHFLSLILTSCNGQWFALEARLPWKHNYVDSLAETIYCGFLQFWKMHLQDTGTTLQKLAWNNIRLSGLMRRFLVQGSNIILPNRFNSYDMQVPGIYF